MSETSETIAELQARIAEMQREQAEADLAASGGLAALASADDIPNDIPDMDVDEARVPRAQETREFGERPQTWRPSRTLPEPDPRPGWKHRWIRVSMLGQIDNTNVSSKFREYWTPVRSEEYPEITVLPDRDSQFPDGIQVGGLVLCRNSEEVVEQRNAHYNKLAKGQGAATDAQFKSEEDPDMPIHTDLGRRTQVQFGKGAPPEV